MANFVRRTAAPANDNAYYYKDNPFHASGYGLPNCTCYAWGRFWECQGGAGSRPRLSLANAEDWWCYTVDGYERGSTPKLGAVICWRKGAAANDSDGAGHVEIVEAINDDGTIVTTGSAYNGYLFREKTRSDDGNWGGGEYIFQGFIYNPVVFDGSSGSAVVKPEPVTGANNRYLTRDEMHQNATYIWWYLSQRGWTANAVAGMLGNMEVESSINPFIWEDLDEGDLTGGFGLVQWTPATKLTNWCSNNGLAYYEMDSQLERLIWEQENENGQFAPAGEYNMTFTEFKNSNLSPRELGMIFLACYERPKDPNQPARGDNAEYWYTYITGLTFDDKKKRKGLSLLLMWAAMRR